MVKIENFMDKYRLIQVFLMVYLFFQPFSRFAGVRNTAFILMLILFIIKLVKGRVQVDLRDMTIQALMILVLVAIVSWALIPYPGESFDSIRQNMAYQVVVFFVIVSEYKSMSALRPLFYSLLAGFAALSLLIVFKFNFSELLNWLDTTRDRSYLQGYSLFAIFFIPLGIGYYCCSVRERPVLRWIIVMLLALEFFLTILNNHRTQFAAILFSAIAVTLLARRFKIFIAGVVVCLIAGFLLYQAKPAFFDRYKTLLSTETYMTNQHHGWNNRIAIWRGTFEMIKERPVIGYGYGWKKLAYVARDGGFLARWDKEHNTYLYFSEFGYGRAGPHNLVLQILFELGVVGLASFLFFWFTVIVKVLSLYIRAPTAGSEPFEAASFLKYGTTGVLISYVLINVSNGLWEESFGVLMMAFAAMNVVLFREAYGRR